MTEINFTIPELARVKAIAISSTPGGDDAAVVLDIDAGAVKDIAQNLNLLTNNITVIETADTIPPNVVNATLNYSTGVLIIETDETIDVTGILRINLNNLLFYFYCY